MSDAAPPSPLTKLIASVVVVASLVVTAITVVTQRQSRALLARDRERVEKELQQTREDVELFETELALKRDEAQRVADRIKAKIAERQQQEVAMAEVMARWQLLVEQQAVFESARHDVEQRLADLYTLEQQLNELGLDAQIERRREALTAPSTGESDGESSSPSSGGSHGSSPAKGPRQGTATRNRDKGPRQGATTWMLGNRLRMQPPSPR